MNFKIYQISSTFIPWVSQESKIDILQSLFLQQLPENLFTKTLLFSNNNLNANSAISAPKGTKINKKVQLMPKSQISWLNQKKTSMTESAF